MDDFSNFICCSLKKSNTVFAHLSRANPGDSWLQVEILLVYVSLSLSPYIIIYYHIWLVVWNIFLMFPNSWDDDPI
jgi:hypothetical protein